MVSKRPWYAYSDRTDGLEPLEHDILTVFWVLIIYHSWKCGRLFLCDSDLTMNM